MSQYVESTDILFLDIAERGLIDSNNIDPCVIKSNFGETHFLGAGKAPKEVLSYTDGLLEKFTPERWRGQATQLIRVEVKACPKGVRLIEIEQRPCGLGVFLEACKRYTIEPPFDIAERLNEVTVLHSVGRTRGGVFFSDEHLFTESIFRREVPRHVHHLIIRSREDEKVPHWLNSRFHSEAPPRMFLLRRNADKVATYKNLDVPHKVFPTYSEGARVPFLMYVKKTMLQTLQDFQCKRCVIKPRRGSRAREVITMNGIEMFNLNKHSEVVRGVQKSAEEYVLQPYYKGMHEEEGVGHLYRLFYIKGGHSWLYIGGFLTLDDLEASKMIVRRNERARSILVTP